MPLHDDETRYRYQKHPAPVGGMKIADNLVFSAQYEMSILRTTVFDLDSSILVTRHATPVPGKLCLNKP